MVPCKEQARNRGPSLVVVFCSRRLVLYATKVSSRPSEARAGTHAHRPVIMGPRLRGDDGRGLGFVWPKSQLGSFGQSARRLLALMLRNIAARRDRRRCRRRSALRCVSKHEGACSGRPHPSRRAHVGSRLHDVSRMRAPLDEDDHRLRHSSPCQTAHLVPAPALLRPGFASLLRSPKSRGGRSAERRSGARRNTRGRARNAARQAPSEAPCVP
jgi:hypothetical protein